MNNNLKYQPEKQLSLFETEQTRLRQRAPRLLMDKTSLINWKQRVYEYQQTIRKEKPSHNLTLFELPPNNLVSPDEIDPFSLKLHSSLFWRMPEKYSDKDENNQGCIYFVLDITLPILLYIGETKLTAKSRWSGVHDCKLYTMNYIQQHRNHNLDCQVLTAFWEHIYPNKNVLLHWEKELIYKWRSPFNKEMWTIYGQPFGKLL